MLRKIIYTLIELILFSLLSWIIFNLLPSLEELPTRKHFNPGAPITIAFFMIFFTKSIFLVGGSSSRDKLQYMGDKIGKPTITFFKIVGWIIMGIMLLVALHS